MTFGKMNAETEIETALRRALQEAFVEAERRRGPKIFGRRRVTQRGLQCGNADLAVTLHEAGLFGPGRLGLRLVNLGLGRRLGLHG